MKTYRIVSDHDGNDAFEVDAGNELTAMREALAVLGWWVLQPARKERPAMQPCPQQPSPITTNTPLKAESPQP
jgi:hypothetical protein